MRKRLINLVVFFLFFSCASVFEAANAQEITLGVPYTSTSYYPYYYQNSYAEFIIHKGQLGPDPITIERLSFLPWSISRSNMHSMGEVSIYMKLTSDSLVVSSPTYNLSDYQLVYEPNPLEIRGWYNEWVDYNLDSEFEYDGEHNISVVIHHQAPESRSSSYYYFASNYVYYGYGYITRYGYNSSSMTAAPTSYGTTSYIPFMKINRDDMKSKIWEYPVDNDHALAWSYCEGYRGGSNSNMYTYYDYGAFEAQYSAPMLGNQPRTINKLRFYVMYRSGTIGGQSSRFKIYLKNDVPSSLAYGASCNQSVDTSDYTKVFDGTYTLSQTYGNFWMDLELDKSFYYDGSSNLYMLFVSNNGSYVYNYYYFFTFYNPSYSGRYTYSSYYPLWQYGTNYFPICDFVGPVDKSASKIAKEEDEVEPLHTYLTSSYYQYFPYYSYRYSATEFVIHKQDLGNTAKILNNMAFLKYSMGSVGGYSTGQTKLPNVTIYLKNTVDSTVTTSYSATGTLRNGSRYSVGGPLDTSASSGYVRVWGTRDMPITGQYGEWYIFNFDQPFQYDGNKHVKVLITYDRGSDVSLNNYNYFTTTYVGSIRGTVMRYIYNNTTWPTATTSWNSSFSYRPYVVFNKESYGNSPVELARYKNNITSDKIEIKCSNNGSVSPYGSTTYFYNSTSIATTYQNQCYVHEMLYTAAELGGSPRMIDRIAFLAYSRTGSVAACKPFDLYMKNTTTQGCLYYYSGTDPSYDTYINFNGYTKVLDGYTYIPTSDSIGKWVEFKLKEPFFYDGESDLLVMYVPRATGASNSNYYTWCTYQKFSYCFRYNTSTSYPGRYNTGTSYCPMVRFGGTEVPPRHTYKSSSVVQLTGRCPEGAPDVPIVGLKVSTKKPFAPYLNMKQIIFNGKKSLNANQVKYAKCYYTTEDKFSTEHPYGDKIAVTSSNINKLVFESNQPIEAKVVYFWLAYDLNEDVPAGSEIDASVVEFTLDYEGEKSTFTPDNNDPNGYKTVHPPLKDKVYTVGVDVGADFENLSLLALDFTELGAKQDITIQVLTDVSDTAAVYFGTNYFGDYNVTIVPGDDVESVTLSAGKKVEEPYINLYRCNNFSIQGDGRLAITASKGVINVEHSDNFSVDGTEIRSASVDAKDAQGIVTTSSNGITLTNNNISSCFNGINLTEAEKVAISGNIIGAATDTKACSHGIAMTDVSNADIDNNKFLNIYGSDESVGLYLANAEDIRIINNTINGMGSKTGDIIGILFDNANKVDIYHNTVYIYPKSTSTEYSNSAILYNLTESKNINLCNNILYSNLLSGEIDAVMYTANTIISNPFNLLGGNIYYSAKAFAMDAKGTKYNFGDWKQVVSILGEGRNETNSYWYEDIDETGAHVFKLISTEDCHLDGPSISDKNFYVPSISAVSVDMDGEDRGSLTTAGSDHVAMEYKQIETDYPSNAYDPEREPISELSLCDNGKDELFLQYEQEFIKWVDEANRTYVPQTENLWVRIPFGKENAPGLYDTLNTNPAFHVLDGRIYSNELTYELSGNYRVYSRIGSNEFVSKDVAVTITKPVTILEQPTDTILACSNAGLISTMVELDGTYKKLQWEYRPDANSDWEDVSGSEDLELKLNTTDEEELHAIVGEYRLRIETPGTCGSTPIMYTNSCVILEGYPITEVSLESNYSREELLTLCENNEVRLKVNSDGTPLGYTWEKYDEVTGEFVEIPAVVNPTAAEQEYRIVSTTADDAGIYRCIVHGPELCLSGSELASETIELGVTVTAKILEQPKSITACVGSSNVVFVPVVSGEVTYQWYKDGYPLEDKTEAILDFYHDITSRFDSLQGKIVYDTLGVRFEDAGMYKLAVYYSNCLGELDTMYSDEVQIAVSGNTEIVNSTKSIYGFRGGYGVLEVETHTLGNPTPVSYQWYRNYSNGYSEKMENGVRVKGATSSRLVITDLEDKDLNDPNNSYDYYYCEVVGACNAVTSDPAYIRVVPEIVKDTDPYSQEKCILEDVEFTVEAHGSEPTEPIKYQWYKDDTPLVDDARIKGSNTDKLQISDVVKSDEGSYYVDVKYVNLNAGITSTTASLTVEEAPIITTQPQDVMMDLINGKEFTLTVKVEDQGIGYLCEYQWYKDGVAIPNATDSYYLVQNASLSDAGKYYVVVTSMKGCGETKSAEATVTLKDSYLEEIGANTEMHINSILPSPATYKATMKYTLSQSTQVVIKMLDITGRNLGNIYTGYGEAGENELVLDLSSYTSGTYYVVLESNNKRVIRSLIITK